MTVRESGDRSPSILNYGSQRYNPHPVQYLIFDYIKYIMADLFLDVLS